MVMNVIGHWALGLPVGYALCFGFGWGVAGLWVGLLIGLGFVSGGYKAWAGKALVSADPVRKGNIEVEVVSPHMVDPTGERMHG